MNLSFRFLAYLSFKIRVSGYEQTGLPRVDARLGAIEARAENLGFGKMENRSMTVEFEIGRPESAKIDPGDNFPVHQHQQAISGQEIGQNRIFLVAAHNLIDGVDYCFQPLKLLNLLHHRRLAHVDASAASIQN